MNKIINAAQAHCEEHGHRLTEPRRAVLEVLTTAEKPMGAYDIIAAMPSGTKPPTVYRALEFWEAEGFVHRIGSIGLYTVCGAGHRHSGAQFMVCDKCGRVEEAHLCDLPEPINRMIRERQFAMTRWNLELHGLCRSCAA